MSGGGDPSAANDPRKARVIFLDPSLGAAGGHHAAVARNYRVLLRDCGREAAFVGHRGARVEAAQFRHRLEDAFRVCRYGARWMGDARLVRAAQWLKRWRPAARDAALAPAPAARRALDGAAFARLFAGLRGGEAIDAGLAGLALQRGEDVVALGLDPAVLTALLERRTMFVGEGAPRLRLVFMYPEADFVTERTFVAYWAAARALAGVAHSVHAEESVHAAALAGQLGRPVSVQPTPVRLSPLPPPPPRSPFVVAALGAGRADKGFHLLPRIAEALRVCAPEARLRVQAPAAGAGLGAVERALRTMNNVTLLPADLAADTYETELAGAHVLLLPYDRARYAGRGSGVLVDARVGGRPYVCTADTALAAAEGAKLTAEDAPGFAAAIAAAMTGYEALLRTAQEQAVRFEAEMRNGALLRALNCTP